MEEVDEPEIDAQMSWSISEMLPGAGQDFVQEIILRHFTAVQQTLQFQDPQFAVGVTAQKAGLLAEQPEEVLSPPLLRVSLQHGPGRAQFGPIAGLALIDEVMPHPLLVSLDLRDEFVHDAVQGGERVLVVRLGIEDSAGQTDDGPDLVSGSLGALPAMTDCQPDLNEVCAVWGQELLQSRQLLLPVGLQACLLGGGNPVEDQMGAHVVLPGCLESPP